MKKVFYVNVIFNKKNPAKSYCNMEIATCRYENGKIHGAWCNDKEGAYFFPDNISDGNIKRLKVLDQDFYEDKDRVQLAGGFYFEDNENISDKVENIRKNIIKEVQKLYEEQMEQINNLIDELHKKKLHLGTFLGDTEEYFLNYHLN